METTGSKDAAGFRRQLAAIVCADVVGYTRLMAGDEDATHSAYKSCMNDIVGPAHVAHRGRIVKGTGDGYIAVFESVADSIACAVEIQQQIESRGADTVAANRMQFRIGVNLGDIIIEDDDVYGDGVNLAARLQELAEPGGICVSSKVFEEVRNKLDVGIVDLGEQRVKNIDEPIRAYWVLLEPVAAGQAVGVRQHRLTWPKWMFAAVACGFVFALGVTAFLWPWAPDPAPSSGEGRSLPLPDKPSIAVMAFANLSQDSDDEYFADGISDDVITDLSRIPGLFVISRNSSFYYKSKPKPIKVIGRELGVRYILEGSVRKFGDRIRLNAQLIDANTGWHIWAQRYDRKRDSIFDIQDEIARRVVTAMATTLLGGTKPQFAQGTRNFEAYDLYLRGQSRLRKTTPADTAEAVALFNAAITIDPTFALAHAVLAEAYLQAARYNWHDALGLRSKFVSEARAMEHIELSMRNPSGMAFRVRADWRYREGRYQAALQDLAQAEARDPNDARTHAIFARVYIRIGQTDQAVVALRKAIRLDPNQPTYNAWLGVAQFTLGNFKVAIHLIEGAFKRNPKDHAHLDHLVASYGHLGRSEKARAALDVMKALRAEMKIGPYTLFQATKSPYYDSECDLYRLREGLRKAGVPEGPVPEPPITGTNCVISPSGQRN